VDERKKILLVDDTESFLFILNDILMHDYDTIISKNGEDALETAKMVKPDLILLDVLMPGMSGLDVMGALNADDEMKSIPVILITGMDSEEDVAKGYEMG
jgi:putative two-component system response regulator